MEVITENELAWAAGFFDGEGSASSYLPRQRITRRRQMQASQGGIPGTYSTVLVRFRDAIGGHGEITGPYRGYLYYWKTTRHVAIDEVTSRIWAYLGEVKRAQLTDVALAVGRELPDLQACQRTVLGERAWAAGLFDGEGCISLFKDERLRPDWRGAGMEIAQSTRGEVPETLERFHAVVGAGAIHGPRLLRNAWTRLPQYRWQVGGRHKVSAVVRILWPWLSVVKREQILSVRAHLDADLDLG